jgi:hypothetical protein
MSMNDPLIVGFLKAVSGFWPLVVVLGAIAWAFLTGTSLIGLIAHGARALAEFGMNMGVRTMAFAALCLFALIVGLAVKNVTNAPAIQTYFAAPTGGTAPSAPAPAADRAGVGP